MGEDGKESGATGDVDLSLGRASIWQKLTGGRPQNQFRK